MYGVKAHCIAGVQQLCNMTFGIRNMGRTMFITISSPLALIRNACQHTSFYYLWRERRPCWTIYRSAKPRSRAEQGPVLVDYTSANQTSQCGHAELHEMQNAIWCWLQFALRWTVYAAVKTCCQDCCRRHYGTIVPADCRQANLNRNSSWYYYPFGSTFSSSFNNLFASVCSIGAYRM